MRIPFERSHRAQRLRPLRRTIIAAATSLAAAAAMAGPARAQTAGWPERAVTLINPFAAGSAVDVVARLVAQKLGENLGRPVNVDNRTGASGNIGTSLAAQAKPDGYTFLLGSPGTMAINPWAFSKLPYDALKDFKAVSQLVSFPQVVVTSPKDSIQSLAGLLSEVRAAPGKITHASSGQGTTAHLAMELIKADGKLDMIHVAYRGGAPAVQAVMAGEVRVGVEGIPSLMGQIRSGLIRPLAVTSSARSPLLPDVPAVAELIPGFDASAWILVMAPAATPDALVERMSQEIARALAAPDVKARLLDQGATIVGSSPAQAAAFHRKELEKFKRAVELSGFKAD